MSELIANPIYFFVLPALIIYAACSDLFRMRISNFVCLSIAAAFYIFAFAEGIAFEQILVQSGFSFLVLVGCFLLFMTGLFGGGDAKLIAALSLWMGVQDNFEFFFLFSLLGGGLTLLIVFLRQYRPMLYRLQPYLGHVSNPANGIPYGIAISMAAIMQIYSLSV